MPSSYWENEEQLPDTGSQVRKRTGRGLGVVCFCFFSSKICCLENILCIGVMEWVLACLILFPQVGCWFGFLNTNYRNTHKIQQYLTDFWTKTD